MPNNPLVYNVTRKYRVSLKQARKAVELCSCAWVDGKIGLEVRDLTLSESIAARNVQAKLQEPIPSAELPGLIFKPAPNAQALTRQGFALIKQANQFCLGTCLN